MAARAFPNTVRCKVRHKALMLKEFTSKKIIQSTGLNAESIRTELQRMREEGFLVSERRVRNEPGNAGAPEVLYRIPDYEAARLLAASIEVFSFPATEQPTSKYYFAAREMLAQAAAQSVVNPELFDETQHNLERAFHAEGGSLASHSIKANLDYEQGLLHYLASNYAKSKEFFERAKDYFQSVVDDALLPRINQYLFCINVREMAKPANVEPATLEDAQRWIEALNQYAAQFLGKPLADLLAEAAQTVPSALAAEAMETDGTQIAALNEKIDRLSRTVEALGEKIAGEPEVARGRRVR
jgi:hypothetical protein